MFTINVDFLGQLPPRASYSKMSIDEIYGYMLWDADLAITYNDQILFSEEVAIIEFYWYLFRWYRRCLAGHEDQFAYSTVEYSAPILVFTCQPNHNWEIDSVWKKCGDPVLINEDMLLSEVQQLLLRIQMAIET